MTEETEEPGYTSVVDYYNAEVMPAIELAMFSEAVNMYKMNQQVSSWIKQLEDEEAKN